MALFNENEYQQAEAMKDSYRPKMGAGGYVCQVQAIRTHGEDSYHRPINYVQDKQYVVVLFDVAEGEHAGRFSDDYFASPDRDYAHRFYLSWKNLRALKRNCIAFDESNPGFDSAAALNAEQWSYFVGKYIGLVFGEEEYMSNDGSIKTRLTLPSLKSVQDIRDGKYRVPALKKLEGATTSTSSSTSGSDQSGLPPVDLYDDIPFSVN